MNRTEETKTETVSATLEAYESAILAMEKAKAVLLSAMRREYSLSKYPYKRASVNRTDRIHEVTWIAPSWVSQVLSGKREPKVSEAIIRLAKGMLALESEGKSNK